MPLGTRANERLLHKWEQSIDEAEFVKHLTHIIESWNQPNDELKRKTNAQKLN